MVSSTINLSRQRAEVITVNIYSFFMCFFYAASVCLFLKYFYPKCEEQISTYISSHKELAGGLTFTTVISVATEILTRIINSAMWSASIDNGFGVLITVWLPQGCIFFMGTCLNICCHIMYLKKTPASNLEETTENRDPAGDSAEEIIENRDPVDDSETTECKDPAGDSEDTTENIDLVGESEETIEMRNLVSDSEKTPENRECLDFFIRCCDVTITRFSANINVHIILPLMLTAYGIIYTAFPTFVLMVAYPTQVIMIVPTAVALLFATVIFSAIMFKLLNYKLSKLRTRQEKIIKAAKFVVYRFIPFYIAVLLLKSVAVIFLYLLIIARGSIATGQLLTLMLSIIPTVLISGISWIAKKTMLDKKKTPSESDNQPSSAERSNKNLNCETHL